MISRPRLQWLLAALFTGCVSTAMAHPHVWVTARAEMVYEADGRIAGIRHAWTFDKGYSAYVIQGLDTNGDGKFSSDELQDLAKENTESLAEFDFFTVLKANGKKQEFGSPRDYRMVYEAEAATLSYFLPLKSPSPTRTMSLEVYDPTFFISFSLADGDDAVKLAGAPQGCATNISRPKPLEANQQKDMSESFFETLTAASNFGTQFANKAIVACP
ncbi:DUF1007 family protein [Microvirga brassicacearum]|uniref:DUF1007 family protein n=1 Tax=Microvirga brassicacearum TaxID=2580413 RepID=A0A5N3PGQ9_9HYPH|nr:DUF1007 family protein [Microvirga brassicacearum]KAB0268913.1 DUF1007 family protein [Microvirga brassicacearum]